MKFTNIFSKIKNALNYFLGSISYKPPAFIFHLWRWLKKIFWGLGAKIKTLITINNRLMKILAIIFCLLAASFIVWQLVRPRPDRISVHIRTPGVTPLQENARPDPLFISFGGSVAKLEDIGKKVSDGIKITPHTRGEWEWLKDDVLKFTPERNWLTGTKYHIELSKELFPPHVLLATYERSFETPPFTARIISNEFYIDPVNENIKQIAATVQFSHPVEVASFENRVTLRPYKLDEEEITFQDREYKTTITYDDFFGKAYILSEALPMPADNVKMILRIDEGVRCAAQGNTINDELFAIVAVPGITNYVKINYISQTLVRNDSYKLEQVLVISSKGKTSSENLLENIEVWVLPDDRPKTPGLDARVNYRWSDPAMIGPEALKLSTTIELQPMESEHEYESLNSFKINVEPGKYLYVKLKKGTPFYGKYCLAKDFEEILQIKEYPKELEIMHEGMILSTTGEKKISLMAQGLDAVSFRVGKVIPDDLNHLISQTNGDITDLRFQNYRFSENNIVENYYESRALPEREPGEPNYFSFDFSDYLQPDISGKLKHGIFFFEVEEWDETHKRATGLREKRLIMISDLGMLIKDGTDDTHELFVQSIATGRPVAGAKVQVLGKNGIPVFSTFTDQQGHVTLSSLESFKNEKYPTVYLVTKGDDLSFMPVSARGRWLNYSKFDIGGIHGATDPKRIEGYLFSDRGIYRPGDTFHIGMIVKSGDWGTSLTGTPLEVAVIDARGLEIFKKKFKLSPEGFQEFKYNTENTSPTGIYQINLYTIKNEHRDNNIGSTTIKVEEFLPDRLSITTKFLKVKDIGWVSPDSLKGLVTLRNLFGTPAVGNTIIAQMKLSPGHMWFKPYSDFNFTDPLSSGKSYLETLPEKETDDAGEAIFNFDLQRFEDATYNLNFIVEGFEKEGGRSVLSESRILVSPLPYLLGTKPNGDLSYIHKGSERLLRIIAINPQLEKTAVPDLQFEINKLQYVSVLTKLPNGTYAYKSVQKSIPIATTSEDVTLPDLDYSLPTNEPGKYELIIKNSDGIQLSRVLFSVIGMANLTGSLDKDAELEVKLDKSSYDPGEEIEIYVRAPYKGAGLITIERDKVYSFQWFKTDKNSFIKKIKVPAELEGNGYVNVSFVRAADSREIYMNPLSYGVAPFSVSKKDLVNAISIDIPAQARSGEPFPIEYKSQKPGKIVVFAVDEGILQVAKYTTPDPLDQFFKKRALEVKTSQLLDLILPEFSLAQSQSAMGGGTGFEEIAKNLNPFKRKRHKPVVFWSGILDCDTKERTLTYTVPDYFNGALRVMAVIVSVDAIGTFEEKAIVKNPYIISPNVPMFAAPYDSFEVSVTITNSVDGSGEKAPVELEVTGTNHLDVLEGKKNLKINEDRDTTVTFYVTVNNLPGSACLNFKVSDGDETTELASYLSVRPAQPYRTMLTTGVLKDDDVEVPTPRQLYEDFRVLKASASFIPLGLSKGLVTYLDQYPYGCTEQVVSQAFPYLYLKDINGFGIDDARAEEKVNYALKVLQARQNSEGKFGIWAANSSTSDFITVYGMHFISECKEAGYYVSNSLFNNGLSALKQIAKKEKKSMRDLRIQAYAIYLLTRNEVVTTNYIASVEKILEDRYKSSWKSDLAGGYIAASYMLMRQEDEANDIFKKTVKSNFKSKDTWYFCNSFIQYAQLLYLVSEHFPAELEYVSASIITNLASYLQRGHYNTITSAYTIMGLNSYAKITEEPREGKVSITQVLDAQTEEILQLPTGKFPSINYSEKAQKLIIANKENIPLYYQVVEGGFNTTLPERRISNGVELFREFTDDNGEPVPKVSLGDEVNVHLKFRSLTKHNLYNIAIVDLLPAGLEAVPTSVRSNTRGSWRPNYTDIREDRLVIFGTVTPEVKEFVYTVRAINRGKFIVPPLYGESMYDRTIYGFSPQEPIIVE